MSYLNIYSIRFLHFVFTNVYVSVYIFIYIVNYEGNFAPHITECRTLQIIHTEALLIYFTFICDTQYDIRVFLWSVFVIPNYHQYEIYCNLLQSSFIKSAVVFKFDRKMDFIWIEG